MSEQNAMIPTGWRIEWDIGTAYDFFISLWALHDPDHLGLRGAWAAGVRSRLPGPEREILQRATPLVRPLPWVHTLPTPKDVPVALKALRALPVETRLLALMPGVTDPVESLWRTVSRRGSWTEDDHETLVNAMARGFRKKQPVPVIRKEATIYLDLWREPELTAETILSAYECYYEVFFIEEEARILPALEAGLARAQKLAKQHERWETLLEEISQGVRVGKDWERKRLILAPSYWGTPLAIMAEFEPDNLMFMFGARPENESLIPGDLVPDALYQALKALADATRLRILRYLSEEPQTPAELARKLRLRPPTVIHHLDALRLARLVIVTLDTEGKRYAIRPDAVAGAWDLLRQFLDVGEE
ncbi:MAG: winged helix-turn-helix transcriptional regulator [Candidatus Promineofilum sp.]|nr:winged helix-turn-helix transcriptional regulator [Promineifilum sp.]MBP9656366.1 winged helix-turn-helix transcriptional regulator [Promineifilum sp.]